MGLKIITDVALHHWENCLRYREPDLGPLGLTERL